MEADAPPDGHITSGTECFLANASKAAACPALQSAGSTRCNPATASTPRSFEGGGAAPTRPARLRRVHGHLTAGASTTRSRTRGVPVGTIKSTRPAKGNASKDEMVASIPFAWTPAADDNEADALALLHWAIETQEV